MAQPYIGEIRMFAGSFAPVGWALCEGQLMPISENDALFTLIGTMYGGDGQETFGIPDLRGRIPIHNGQGPGISQTYQQAEKAGVESVTLTIQQIPNHTHALVASGGNGSEGNPGGNFLASSTSISAYAVFSPDTAMASNALTPAGGSQPHDNIMPFLCVNFIISLFGLFPTQT